MINNQIEENTFNTQESFAELFENSIKSESKKEGSLVKGKVVKVDSDAVTVDIGLKTEGRIPVKEFVKNGVMENVAPGDIVDVYLESYENHYGRLVLSRERAIREESWIVLEKALEKGQPVDGVVFGKVKGGLTVDLNGVIAFLPGSQIDIRPIKDVAFLMGVVQPFMILKVDRMQGNIVVSRRAIIEESRQEARNEMLSQIQEGQVLDGVVKNITDYGAFIDLGSIDGLLHVTDISWNKVSHPSELLSIGQNIKVKVIKFDEKTKRVSLGMKQLEQNPWEGLAAKYPIGSKLKGQITNITDYGAFIELEPGIEGLVHVSEMTWSKSNLHPKKLVTEGQEIEFVILDVDVDKHRISLGMKQCINDPWKQFSEKYPVGTILEGEVRNVVEFGLFIGLEEDVDGLVHISDISWGENQEEDIKQYKKSDVIKVVVLAVDSEKERISLGIKQLIDDPFENAFKNIKTGGVVTCTVLSVEDGGINVEVAEGISAFVKKSELSSDKVEQRPDRFAIGDRVDAKVVALDKTNRKLTLSIKALEDEQKKRAIAEYGSVSSGASLGDILGAALSKAEKKKAD
jgi:small subunit ribosomal protein S1